MAPASPTRQTLLLYEPRIEGHHLPYLRMMVEDLLAADFRLSLAVDLRNASRQRVEQHLDGLPGKVSLLSAYDESGRRHLDGKCRSVAHCLRASGADHVFLCEFDEIASHCWRRATFGIFPPDELRGRMGGIYYRPRFVRASLLSPGRWLKQIGFRRMMLRHWLRPLLLADEFLARDLQAQFPGAPIFFLPDPCPAGFEGNRHEARQKLEVPAGKFVLLFYGGGYRRKGLRLAIRAMLALPPDSPAFLLCAGQLDPAGQIASGLDRLVRQNRALLINRYVSAEEEKLCFLASDTVLLPYLNHFGSSSVLSRAVAARRPVIVSDEQLLGRMTREHKLGLVFPSGDATSLSLRMQQAIGFTPEELAAFRAAAEIYCARYSREAFRLALTSSLRASIAGSRPG